MSQFLAQRELFDRILHLKEEEKQDPIGVIEHYFADYRLHECRHYLWTMVETCLTTENDGFNDPAERGNLLLHYRDLERLLEAAAILAGRAPLVPPAGPQRELSEKIVMAKSKPA